MVKIYNCYMALRDKKEMCVPNKLLCHHELGLSNCKFTRRNFRAAYGMAQTLNRFEIKRSFVIERGIVHFSVLAKPWSCKIPMSEGFFEPL